MNGTASRIDVAPCSAFWLLASVLACAPRAPSSYEVIVRAESEAAKPLAGAQVSFNAQVVGTSDAHGLIALRLRGNPGDVVTLQASCPEGHRAPREPLTAVLRALSEQGKIPEYPLLCPPLKRSLVISVRASNGPNMALRYQGREIARTDEAGAAHAWLVVTPGESVTVKLDTSSPEHASLMPQQPELKLTVPERDEMVVFEQTFTRPKPPRRRHVKPEPTGPQRI